MADLFATLVTATRFEITSFLALLAAVIVWRMLTGGIGVDGLLSDDSGTINPNALQMLLLTLVAAAYYLMKVTPEMGTHALPDIPLELLLVYGVSHASFTGPGLFRALQQWSRRNS